MLARCSKKLRTWDAAKLRAQAPSVRRHLLERNVMCTGDLLDHIQMAGDHIRSLARCVLHQRRCATVGFFLKVIQIVFVVLDHVLDVFLVEFRPGESAQLFYFYLL